MEIRHPMTDRNFPFRSRLWIIPLNFKSHGESRTTTALLCKHTHFHKNYKILVTKTIMFAETFWRCMIYYTRTMLYIIHYNTYTSYTQHFRTSPFTILWWLVLIMLVYDLMFFMWIQYSQDLIQRVDTNLKICK